jgi:hypothetical protein
MANQPVLHDENKEKTCFVGFRLILDFSHLLKWYIIQNTFRGVEINVVVWKASLV